MCLMLHVALPAVPAFWLTATGWVPAQDDVCGPGTSRSDTVVTSTATRETPWSSPRC